MEDKIHKELYREKTKETYLIIIAFILAIIAGVFWIKGAEGGIIAVLAYLAFRNHFKNFD